MANPRLIDLIREGNPEKVLNKIAEFKEKKYGNPDEYQQAFDDFVQQKKEERFGPLIAALQNLTLPEEPPRPEGSIWVKVVERILELGANPNEMYQMRIVEPKRPVFHYVCEKVNNQHQGKLIELFLKYHVDPDPEYKFMKGRKETALMWLLSSNPKDLAPLRQLLAHPKVLAGINYQNSRGQTALSKAKSVEAIKLLLEKKADLKAGNGNTLLHLYAEKVFNVQDCEAKLSDFNTQNVDGFTPLLLAASYTMSHVNFKFDVCKDNFFYLLKNSADATICTKSGENLLHLLIKKTDVTGPPLDTHFLKNLQQQLLNLKPEELKKMLEQKDAEGCTPLHIATRSSDPTVFLPLIQFLLPLYEKSKADLNLYNENGHTPLQNLIYQYDPQYRDNPEPGVIKAIENLCSAGANPSAKIGGANGEIDCKQFAINQDQPKLAELIEMEQWRASKSAAPSSPHYPRDSSLPPTQASPQPDNKDATPKPKSGP